MATTSSIKAFAALKKGAPLEAFEFDPGALRAEQVEVAVTHCGICHSDLSMIDNEWGQSVFPLVPGHEVAGVITAVGAQVKGLKVGQRVGVGWFSASCLACRHCLSGDHHLCDSPEQTIVARHGGF